MVDYEKQKAIWIVCACNTNEDGVTIARVFGTMEQIKKYMLSWVQIDKENDEECYEYGAETVEDIKVSPDFELYAYSTFSHYHADYTAKPYEELNLEYADEL